MLRGNGKPRHPQHTRAASTAFCVAQQRYPQPSLIRPFGAPSPKGGRPGLRPGVPALCAGLPPLGGSWPSAAGGRGRKAASSAAVKICKQANARSRFWAPQVERCRGRRPRLMRDGTANAVGQRQAELPIAHPHHKHSVLRYETRYTTTLPAAVPHPASLRSATFPRRGKAALCAGRDCDNGGTAPPQ